MFSRKVAAVAAFSLLLATSPSMAQTADPAAPPPPTTAPTKSGNPLGDQDAFTQSGLFLMLTAIAGAILLTVLATQLGGDEPASP
jgi:hypothetical protein